MSVEVPPERASAASEAQLRAYFDACFQDFLTAERDNILHGTSERSLCGRLALVLESRKAEFLGEGYFADTEYNRKQGGQVKTILDANYEIVSITCDIIVHSRGRIVTQDNLIAIEMKRSSHPEREKAKDRMRLRALTKASYDNVWSADGETLPEHVCGYVLGYFLELDATSQSFSVEEYAGGEFRRSFSFAF